MISNPTKNLTVELSKICLIIRVNKSDTEVHTGKVSVAVRHCTQCTVKHSCDVNGLF